MTQQIACKRCTLCHEVKPLTDFGPFATHRDGLTSRCRACLAADQRAREKAEPEKYLARNRAFRAAHADTLPAYFRRKRLEAYGLTPEKWDEMLAAQGGVCAICKGPGWPDRFGRRFHVDHDHQTGRIRGLLCVSCNRALGFLLDDPERARAAAAYLEQR